MICAFIQMVCHSKNTVVMNSCEVYHETISLKYVERSVNQVYNLLFWKWCEQDVELEPPARPPLPQEMQESHQRRNPDSGWTELPYEVRYYRINVEITPLTCLFILFLCVCFRNSTTTLVTQHWEEETVSLTSLTWNPRKTHSVGTDTLTESNRVYRKNDINTVHSYFLTYLMWNINMLVYMLLLIVVSSSLIFPFLPFFLSSSPLPSSIFISSIEPPSGSKWIPPDATRQTTKVRLWFPVSWPPTSGCDPHPSKDRCSQGWLFLIAITAKFQFFDSLIFLAIRACCNACSRRGGAVELHVHIGLQA